MQAHSTAQNPLYRAQGVILNQNRILLMKRIRDGMTFYTLPGGKVEASETPEAACQREVFEECAIHVSVGHELFRMKDVFQDILNIHVIYQCDYLSGSPTLNGEEKDRCTADNYYEPLWVSVDDAKDLNLKPDFLKPFFQKIFGGLK